jgi:hypothetical protein
MKRWDLIAVMERQQREYEALAIFHGWTPAGIDRMKRSLRRKFRYARGELQQRVWGELCRRTGCKAPCMGDNFHREEARRARPARHGDGGMQPAAAAVTRGADQEGLRRGCRPADPSPPEAR